MSTTPQSNVSPISTPQSCAATSTPVTPPIPPYQAQNQGLGLGVAVPPGGLVNAPSGGIFNNPIITTTAGTATAGTYAASSGFMTGSSVIYISPSVTTRKPRKPREKRQIPLFTAGLEAKLNKCLDKDVSKIIKLLSKQTQQAPTIRPGVDEDIYEFNAMFTYATSTGFSWGNNSSMLVPIQQQTVMFFAELCVRLDGTLRQFEIRMRGEKK